MDEKSVDEVDKGRSMDEPVAPTAEDYLERVGYHGEGDMVSVQREFDDDWRHGGTVTNVIYRKSDDTFWCFCYRVSADGDWNGMRENDYGVSRVYPVEKTIITYVTDKPE